MAAPLPTGQRSQPAREPVHSRSSNTLRASVLDAALELGFGTSRAVENWMFNAVEEDDEEDIVTPALTSASAATSDESSPSIPTHHRNLAIHFVVPPPQPADPLSTFPIDANLIRAPSDDSHSDPMREPHRKLRKARKEGHESDGGHLGDGGKKKKDKKDKKKDKKENLNVAPEMDYESDHGHISDALKKGSKKKKKDKKTEKAVDGYATDASTRSYFKAAKKVTNVQTEDGELSDGGYLSEASVKKKRSFFRLGSRSSSRKGGTTDAVAPPPVPALPPLPLPIAERFARSPAPSFDLPDGGYSRGATPIPTPSPIPPPVLAPVASTPLPADDRAMSPLPSMDNIRSAAASPLSVRPSVETLTSSNTSHDSDQHSYGLSPVQSHEVAYDLSPIRSREDEVRALSPVPPHDQAPSPAPAMRRHGVRFTPSTRFSPSDLSFPMPPSPPLITVVPEKPPRPKISLPITSTLNPTSPSLPASPVPPILRASSPLSAPPESRPFFVRPLRTRRAPSPLMLPPSPSPFLRGNSPALSDYSVISSSEFLVPSPRARFIEDLPPPSPPPQGPLPDVPSPQPSGPGLFAQPIPAIKRGRELPFPQRGVLPADEASQLIERTERTRQQAIARRAAGEEDAWPSDAPLDLDGAVSGWLDADADDDDEPVRADIAQFYLFAPDDAHARSLPPDLNAAPAQRWLDVPDDERSNYTASARGSRIPSMQSRGETESFYFDDEGADSASRLSRASFVDDERSREMRARLIARVDAMYGAELAIPPVPPLRTS
ncbi:hypothetical protein BC834DRAFT_970483 [Gloeopeniophorella convolvens]|nr:hypothetical protein BC834DRAFT_970483 [Gloeopeniophorella convolvens]